MTVLFGRDRPNNNTFFFELKVKPYGVDGVQACCIWAARKLRNNKGLMPEAQNRFFLFDFCFTALQHILGQFGRGQLN